MSKKLTKDKFVEKAILIHGNKYNYENSIYVKCDVKITIDCSKHGLFSQIPESHLQGVGCPKCGAIKLSNSLRKTKEQVISELTNIFGENTYLYNNLNYIDNRTKIAITCPTHGDFLQNPSNAMKGWGCPACGEETQTILKKERFFTLAKEKHNNFYKYDNSVYIGSNKDIIITCPNHGNFLQKPKNHLSGHGCYECARLLFGKAVKSNTQDFIRKSKLIHGNTYNYDKVDYKDADTKVTIKCSIHGEFEQIPRSHLSNCGCPTCHKYQGYSRSQWVNYNKGKEGIFYIIRCWKDEEFFYKIGITGNTVKERYPYGGDLKYNWKIIKEVKSTDLEYLWDLEKKIKNELKNFKYKPKIKFAGGAVECFSLIKMSYICTL